MALGENIDEILRKIRQCRGTDEIKFGYFRRNLRFYKEEGNACRDRKVVYSGGFCNCRILFNLLHPPGVQVSLNQGEGFLPFPNFYL